MYVCGQAYVRAEEYERTSVDMSNLRKNKRSAAYVPSSETPLVRRVVIATTFAAAVYPWALGETRLVLHKTIKKRSACTFCLWRCSTHTLRAAEIQRTRVKRFGRLLAKSDGSCQRRLFFSLSLPMGAGNRSEVT